MYSNPLHFSVFPSARQMETEVLQMLGTELGQSSHHGLVLSDEVEVAIITLLAVR